MVFYIGNPAVAHIYSRIRLSNFGHVSSIAVRSGRSIQFGKYHYAGRPGLRCVAIALAVSGCSRAPTMDLLGSYFPAWMLCAVLGVVAAVIIWRILAIGGIDEYVVAPLLTYAGLALSVTLLVWLLWFGH
jgi:hypothetical protein